MTQDASAQQLRAYLVEQAARHDWRALWPRVIGPRAALLDALAEVTEGQADWHAADGWSIREVAEHVVEYSRNVLDVIESTARGKPAPKDPPGATLPGPRLSFAELRRAIVEESERIATVRTRVPEPPNDTVTVEHSRFGPLNCRAWFLFLRIHDMDHTNQVNAIKAAPDYPGGARREAP